MGGGEHVYGSTFFINFFQAFQQILVGQDSRHFGIYFLTAESGPVGQETEKGTVQDARFTGLKGREFEKMKGVHCKGNRVCCVGGVC